MALNLRHSNNPDDFRITGLSGRLYFQWCGPSGFGSVEIITDGEDGSHHIEGEMLTRDRLIVLLTSLVNSASIDREIDNAGH